MLNSDFPNEFAGDETPDWTTWKVRTVNAVKRICSDHSPACALAMKGDCVRTEGNGPGNFELAQSSLLKSLDLTRDILESDVHGELRSAKSAHVSPALSYRIFVVHGHDTHLATDVERFVREIGLEPVILHRQVDEGATIIEKFEKNSDVGFAFVLLTPDEIAYTIDQDMLKIASEIRKYALDPTSSLNLATLSDDLAAQGCVACIKEKLLYPVIWTA